MYYYFSGGYPTAIKLGGIYYGVITDTVKPLRIDDDACPLVEVCPLSSTTGQLTFILNQEFLSNPTDGVLVTDLNGGYLIKFLPPVNPSEFNIITQKKLPDAVFTLFTENGVKLSIETPCDFYAENFKFSVNSAEFLPFVLNGKPFVALSLAPNDLLAVYSLEQKIRKVFSRQVSSFSLDDGFTTTEVYKDMAKHTVKSTWCEKDGALIEQSRTVDFSPSFKRESVLPPLVPYAFLEELLVGGDYEFYTTGTIKENIKHVKGFFGDFIGVMPPPEFVSSDLVGVIYKKTPNLYRVEYFSFCLTDGKISKIGQIE